MHRFFVSPSLIIKTAFLNEPDIVHQIYKVLRKKSGDQIILCDNTGTEYIAEITEISKKEVRGKIIEKRENQAEPEIKITLYQALPKNPAKFEQVLQHGTEIGITKFVPILTERTEVQKLRNIERAKRIIRESAEQSERGKLPELAEPIRWNDIWKNPPTGLNLVADSYTFDPLLNKLLPKIKNEKFINIFVGPEGGFTKTEIGLAAGAKARCFSLGPRILRTETAGLSIASAILFS